MEAGKNFLFFFLSFPPNFIFPPVAQGVGGGVPAGTGVGGEEGKNFFFSMFGGDLVQ